MKKTRLLFFTVFLFSLSISQAQIKIDGVFFDWNPSTQLDISPNEEKTFGNGDPDTPDSTRPSYFADLDIDDVFATEDADFIYLRIKMNSVGSVFNIANDSSYHGGAAIAAYISVDPGTTDTTGLTWGWWGSGYDFFVQSYPVDSLAQTTTRYQQFVWEHKQSGNGWDYEVKDTLIGAQVAWNTAGNEVEMAIPKSLIFHPKYLSNFQIPQNIAIMIYAGENSSPWRADYASLAGKKGYLLNLKNPALVSIDGVFFDWQGDKQLDVVPNEEKTFANGDNDAPDPANPSYFADLDIDDVFATDDQDFVYLRIKMNSIGSVNNIANDTSYHGGAAIAAYISVDPGAADTTGLTWGWWGNGYDFFAQVFPADTLAEKMTGYQQLLWEHKQSGNGWDYEPADTLRGCWVGWNAQSNDVEMAIPKSLLLSPKYLPNFIIPNEIAIMIYAGENSSPWRADYASLPGVKGYLLKLIDLTDISEKINSKIPSEFKLSQNYPNPFNPTTKINFALPSENYVKIRVFNVLGKEVAILANSVYSAGNHSVEFDAKALSTGIYFYSIETGNFKQVNKMLLLK
ncbi:MAG: T9SS type A sorting domain-containing protein [Ignavibacteriaceae bacterium]